MSETKTYRIHAHRTGYGTQTRIIVMCGVKLDDVLCPNAATASRRLREMRAEYGVRRVLWSPASVAGCGIFA